MVKPAQEKSTTKEAGRVVVCACGEDEPTFYGTTYVY